MSAFEEFGVLPELGKAVEEMEWTLPTDVQAEAVPLILGGGDVLMAAETGSGKTGAFCLPILQIVWETLKDLAEGKGLKGATSSPQWALSISDRGHALVIDSSGMTCEARDFKVWHGCRATMAVYGKGAYFYEATVCDEGLCRVGWSTQAAVLDLGTDRYGFGFGGTGKKSNCKNFETYGEAFGMNDVIGCYLNLDSGDIRFSKNGVDLGTAFTLNQQQKRDAYFPALVVKNAKMQFNFGATPFKYPPPSGYSPIIEANKDYIKLNATSVGSIATLKPVNNAPQAIIIEPSRELAEQTYNQIIKFKKYLDAPAIKELLVIGGVNIKDQIATLNDGVNIVIGTPGRLENLIQEGYLDLTHCRFFVLDEADGLLKAGYTQMIESLHRQMPKMTADGRRLQMIVCSATLHAFEVKKMAENLMHFPTWVDLKGEDAVPETVHHCVVMVDPQKDRSWEQLGNRHIPTDKVHDRDNVRPGATNAESLSEAVKILKGEYCIRAIEEHNMDRAIIFCRTKLDCDNLEKYLQQTGGKKYSCVCLHGDRKPQERKANLESFKREEVKFLICTDVAARGLDISGLPFMINVTLPDEKSNYVHRIGRVGRAERMGLAISLVSSVPEKVWYHGEWCSSRGRNCYNTNLTDAKPKGCCMWYNEPRYLADIEDHLNITIQQVQKDLKVPCNEFDGKVTYGEKRKAAGSDYKDHVSQMAPVVIQLADLESQAQLCYLQTYHNATVSS